MAIRKNTINAPIGALILGALILACAGSVCRTGSSDKTAVAPSSTPSYLTSSPLPISSAPVETPTNSRPHTKTALSGKTASVISENVILRKTPNETGEIVQTVANNEKVEIVKQKHAWFFIRLPLSDKTGWVHGNTIRIEDEVLKNVPNSTSVSNSSVPENSVRSSSRGSRISRRASSKESSVINNSGATAQCRDGSLSYSAHRRGTCSHHGGVAEWF